MNLVDLVPPLPQHRLVRELRAAFATFIQATKDFEVLQGTITGRVHPTVTSARAVPGRAGLGSALSLAPPWQLSDRGGRYTRLSQLLQPGRTPRSRRAQLISGALRGAPVSVLGAVATASEANWCQSA